MRGSALPAHRSWMVRIADSSRLRPIDGDRRPRPRVLLGNGATGARVRSTWRDCPDGDSWQPAPAWPRSGDGSGPARTRLAQPLRPADVPTTLQQTIRQRSVGNINYRTLATAPGEPHVPRLDLLGKAADPARTARRRSLVYLGHMTDIHITWTRSPRLGWNRCRPRARAPGPGRSARRTHLTTNVQAQMVAAMNAAAFSPVTGAPMAAVFNTGDSADQHSTLELRWYIDVPDGQSLTPNSGAAGQYEGPRCGRKPPTRGTRRIRRGLVRRLRLPDHPRDADRGSVADRGVRGLGRSLVRGLRQPRHLYYGAFEIGESLRALALGDRKPALYPALAQDYFAGMRNESTVLGRLEHELVTNFGMQSGMRAVTPTPTARSSINCSSWQNTSPPSRIPDRSATASPRTTSTPARRTGPPMSGRGCACSAWTLATRSWAPMEPCRRISSTGSGRTHRRS